MDKKYDELLKETQLLRKIIEAIPDYLTYKNNKGIFEVVSMSANEQFDNQFESIIGMNYDQLFSKEVAKEIHAFDQEVIKKQDYIRKLITIETGYGKKQLDSTRTPIYDDDNKIQGVLALSRDISDVVRAKSDLENYLSLQKVIIGISKRFVESRLDDFNAVMEDSLERLGRTIGADRVYFYKYNFLGKTMDNQFEWVKDKSFSEQKNNRDVSINDYLTGWVTPHRNNEVVFVLNTAELDRRTNLFQMLKAKKIKSMLSLPIFVENECYGFIGFDSITTQAEWENLTEQLDLLPEIYSSFILHRRILIELEQAKEDAQKASNIQSDFIGKMTHEIRTPINGVSNAMFLLGDTELSTEQQEYLGVMKYSLEVLNNMVSNILDYSKIEVNKLKRKSSEISLENEVIKLIKVNKYMANNKGLGLYLNYDYRIPTTITTDVEKIRQILNNLIINAVKYTNYGHVEVNVDLLSLKPPYVDVKFEIKDTGIGISETNLNHIFDSFYQVGDVLNKNPFGTGLGLTIVKDLVHFLDGELSVQSKERQGSTFSFVLTFYTPIEETRQPLDMSALLIDLTSGPHSDVKEMLTSHFDVVSVCTERNVRSFKDGDYDFYFVYTNNTDDYQVKIDLISNVLGGLTDSVRKVLLFDTVKDEIILDTMDMFDFVLEIPESSEVLLDQVTRSPEDDDNVVYGSGSLENVKPRILLVDDNNINRKVMGQLLESMDVEVTEAANGFDAVDLASKKKFDMIFMDILMPGMDGYETTKKIRELEGITGSLPILAVTANDPASTEEKAIEYGMNGVLGKPLYKADLEKLLEQYFGTGEVIREKRKKEEKGAGVFDQREFEQFYPDVAIRKEILKTVIEDKDKDLREIMQAFATSNGNQIHDKMHYMKGSFTYLRAKRLVVLSQTIMDFCKQKMVSEAVLLEDSYVTNFLELIEELENYMVTM